MYLRWVQRSTRFQNNIIVVYFINLCCKLCKITEMQSKILNHNTTVCYIVYCHLSTKSSVDLFDSIYFRNMILPMVLLDTVKHRIKEPVG